MHFTDRIFTRRVRTGSDSDWVLSLVRTTSGSDRGTNREPAKNPVAITPGSDTVRQFDLNWQLMRCNLSYRGLQVNAVRDAAVKS